MSVLPYKYQNKAEMNTKQIASYSQSSVLVKTRIVFPLKSWRAVVPATDDVYSSLGFKGLNFIPVMDPPAPIYNENRNLLSEGRKSLADISPNREPNFYNGLSFQH